MKGILTLDLASRLGFCKWNPGQTPKIGTYLLPEVQNDSYGKRSWTYRQWLLKALKETEAELCVYEKNLLVPKRDTVHKINLSCSLVMITEEVCYEMKVRCASVPVREWRKHYLGHGDYPTEEAKEYAMNRAKAAGFNPQHHDAAEALGIMDYTADLMKLRKDWPDSNIFGGLLGKPQA